MSLCVRGYTELRSCCLTHFIVLQIRIVWKSQITLFLTLTLCGNQQNLQVLLYNHGEGPYLGFLLVESGYSAFIFKTLC